MGVLGHSLGEKGIGQDWSLGKRYWVLGIGYCKKKIIQGKLLTIDY